MTIDHLNQVENEAAEALADHAAEVGTNCIRDNRAPTQAEIDRFDELADALDQASEAADELHRQAVAALNESAIRKYERMLEGRGY